MAYEIALNKAWSELDNFKPEGPLFKVRFLDKQYSIDLENRKISLISSDSPAKDFTSILILHYLLCSMKGMPTLTGIRLGFREIAGIEGYNASFRKRVVEPVIKKYGNKPEGIYSALDKFPSAKSTIGDAGVVITAFQGVPVEFILWRGDDEFSAEANVLFDQSIKEIFCIEDMIVLAGLVASAL